MQLIQRAKHESTHQEKHIYTSIGVSSELLNGKGHPCPKCGGTDRFSFREKTGALHCRGCFSDGSHPDVVGSVAWFLDIDDQAAARKILDHLNIDWKAERPKKGKVKYTFKQIEPGKYNESLAMMWTPSNPPITPAAIEQAGGTFGKWFQNQVLCFPVVGPKKKKEPFSAGNCEPIAYTMYSTMQGGPRSQVLLKRGEEMVAQRSVTVNKYESSSSQVGIIGPWQRLQDAEFVLKCEGTTDMLAANSLFPDGWVAISNSCGAGATAEWIAASLAGKVVYVIGDNDDAGRKGAEKWAKLIAKHAAKTYRPILPSAGQDLRDFLKEKTTEQFLAFLSNSSGEEISSPQKNEDPEDEDLEDEIEKHLNRCLADLGIDVLFEDENDHITIYCASTKKTRVIRDLGKLSMDRLYQHVGWRAEQYVSGDPEPHQYSLSTVKKAIGMAASGRSVQADEIQMCGPGLWRIDGKIVAVNGTHVAIWDGEKLEVPLSPRVGKTICDLGRQDWFDLEKMREYIFAARDVEWRKEAVEKLVEIISRWTWRHHEDPVIVSSILGATTMQAIWDWRPLFSLIGPSDAGKSSLLDFIGKENDGCLFSPKQVFRSHDTTYAGIAQKVKFAAPIIIVDEWDGHSEAVREQILKGMRGSSGGSESKRGSAHHKAKHFQFRHICWLVGIFSNIDAEADQNRFIEVALTPPPRERYNAWRAVEPEEAADLGLRLYAISMVCAAAATARQPQIAKMDVGGRVPNRILRNLSVPIAWISEAMGLDDKAAEDLLLRFLSSFGSEESIDPQPLPAKILESLLKSKVHIGRGETKTVGALISSQSDRSQYWDYLTATGCCLKISNGKEFLYITSISSQVPELKMRDRSIRSTLMTIPGAERARLKCGSTQQRGILVPWDYLREEFAMEVSFAGIDDTGF